MAISAQDPNEILDVVDEKNCVVTQATRAEIHAQKLLHRAVHILVFDALGRLFVQKRSLLKDTCPGLYSTSCAGHLDSGENYQDAALRELHEELGIDLSKPELKFLFSQPPSPQNGYEFIEVYAVENFTGTLTPAPAEIEQMVSFYPRELEEEIEKSPEKFAKSFIKVWKTFQEQKTAHLI